MNFVENLGPYTVDLDVDGSGIDHALYDLSTEIEEQLGLSFLDNDHINSAMTDTNRCGFSVDEVKDIEVKDNTFTATLVIGSSDNRKDDVMWCGDTVIAKIKGAWETVQVTLEVTSAEIDYPDDRDRFDEDELAEAAAIEAEEQRLEEGGVCQPVLAKDISTPTNSRYGLENVKRIYSDVVLGSRDWSINRGINKDEELRYVWHDCPEKMYGRSVIEDMTETEVIDFLAKKVGQLQVELDRLKSKPA